MLVGVLPAVLTLFIRLMVPESERWERERDAGKAAHWSGRDLLAVLGGAAAAAGVIAVWAMPEPDWLLRGIVTPVGFGLVVAGFLFPAWRYLARSTADPGERRKTLGRMLLGAGLSGVPLLATWAGVMWQYNFVDKLTGGAVPEARPMTMVVSAIGAAFGAIAGAVLGERFGRRPVYAVLCVLSLAVLLGFYSLNRSYGWWFVASAGLVGAVSAAFYGWLPLYLPELFPTPVRASGQGFAFNGYLPVAPDARSAALRRLEADSARSGNAQLFIETPYRNAAMLEAIVGHCKATTRLCIAVDLTTAGQEIVSQPVGAWRDVDATRYHKRPAVFILQAA
jgi:MFS family permease